MNKFNTQRFVFVFFFSTFDASNLKHFMFFWTRLMVLQHFYSKNVTKTEPLSQIPHLCIQHHCNIARSQPTSEDPNYTKLWG